MHKDIIISVLAAELLLRRPWYAGCTGLLRIVLVIATAIVVFIFMAFMKDSYARFIKYARRVQKIRNIVRKLR